MFDCSSVRDAGRRERSGSKTGRDSVRSRLVQLQRRAPPQTDAPACPLHSPVPPRVVRRHTVKSVNFQVRWWKEGPASGGAASQLNTVSASAPLCGWIFVPRFQLRAAQLGGIDSCWTEEASSVTGRQLCPLDAQHDAAPMVKGSRYVLRSWCWQAEGAGVINWWYPSPSSPSFSPSSSSLVHHHHHHHL